MSAWKYPQTIHKWMGVHVFQWCLFTKPQQAGFAGFCPWILVSDPWLGPVSLMPSCLRCWDLYPALLPSLSKQNQDSVWRKKAGVWVVSGECEPQYQLVQMENAFPASWGRWSPGEGQQERCIPADITTAPWIKGPRGPRPGADLITSRAVQSASVHGLWGET